MLSVVPRISLDHNFLPEVPRHLQTWCSQCRASEPSFEIRTGGPSGAKHGAYEPYAPLGPVDSLEAQLPRYWVPVLGSPYQVLLSLYGYLGF